MVAKYGDKSVYFDLEDLGNTTGKWDLYGSDAGRGEGRREDDRGDNSGFVGMTCSRIRNVLPFVFVWWLSELLVLQLVPISKKFNCKRMQILQNKFIINKGGVG